MEKWIILNKLIVLAYIILQFFSGRQKYTAGVIVLLLIYICLNTVFYLVKNDRLGKIMQIGLVIMVIGSWRYYSNLLALFLPDNLFELCLMFTCSHLFSSGMLLAG